jgi:hypothetical protein
MIMMFVKLIGLPGRHFRKVKGATAIRLVRLVMEIAEEFPMVEEEVAREIFKTFNPLELIRTASTA